MYSSWGRGFNEMTFFTPFVFHKNSDYKLMFRIVTSFVTPDARLAKTLLFQCFGVATWNKTIKNNANILQSQ